MKKLKQESPFAASMTGYKFVAAATMFKKFAGQGLYVKYQNNKTDKISVIEASKDHIWYRCPDRDLVLTVQEFKSASFRPEKFDRYLSLNLLNDEVPKGFGVDYVMTNYEHDPHVYHRRDKKNPQVQVLSDSGGLQLVRGVSDYINPVDLQTYYNNNVDAGMSLDIPIWVHDSKLIARGANVQRRNNEVMLEMAKPGVELINIIHGNTVEERMLHNEIVYNDKITRCALGGFNRMKLLTGINLIFELTSRMNYKQYHVLGVFSVPYIAALVKIANTGKFPHITSDATSHIQEANAGGFFYRANEAQMMIRMPMGTLGGSIQNCAMHLACNCPICSTIKYRDILAFSHSRFFTFLATHNMGKIAEYAASLEHACRNLSPEQYNTYVCGQLRKNAQLRELEMTLDFIDIVNEKGLKHAQAKYKNYLQRWKEDTSFASNMFEAAQEKTQTKALHERTLQLFDIYEERVKPVKKGAKKASTK